MAAEKEVRGERFCWEEEGGGRVIAPAHVVIVLFEKGIVTINENC